MQLRAICCKVESWFICTFISTRFLGIQIAFGLLSGLPTFPSKAEILKILLFSISTQRCKVFIWNYGRENLLLRTQACSNSRWFKEKRVTLDIFPSCLWFMFESLTFHYHSFMSYINLSTICFLSKFLIYFLISRIKKKRNTQSLFWNIWSVWSL